jgi:flagellar biosynthetic protein FlhB
MARPEQTERATPKRREEARSRGQVPRSPDLSGAVVFLAIISALHFTFLPTMSAGAQSFAVALSHASRREDLNLHSVWPLFFQSAQSYTLVIGAAFLGASALAILANVVQFGFLFAPGVLSPKFFKLNPLEGFRRIFFSPQTLVNLAKQFVKLAAVGLIVYLGIKDRLTTFYALAMASPHDIMVQTEDIVWGIGLRFGLFLLALGLVDYLWERRRLEDSLKMTRTEVRDEQRQQEGNPELRSALRRRQRVMARRRMMAAVPRATVVITNPTHFAVALEWDDEKMEAPVVTAKGADVIARRIREVAREHDVPIVENPPLARTLYDKVELDSPVPANLYATVAQVIAFVFKLKKRTIA